MSERCVFSFSVLNNPLNSIPTLQIHTEKRRLKSRVIFRERGRQLSPSGCVPCQLVPEQQRNEDVQRKPSAPKFRRRININVFFRLGYLPGVSRHPPGHHPLQVTAQTHSLHRDDGLLGEDGAEDGGGSRIRTNSLDYYRFLCNTWGA